MGWIVFGFVTAILFEVFIRVISGYEPAERRETVKTQLSLPWYGWGLLGYGLLKKNKRRR